GLEQPLDSGDALARELDEHGVLLAVGDRVELERGGEEAEVELLADDREPVGPFARAADEDPGLDLAVAGDRVRGRVVARVGKAHEVGVRVEDDDAELRLVEEPLEDDAERIRLARARLAAEERMPVEAARVERERNAGRERELADDEPGARGRARVEVGADL